MFAVFWCGTFLLLGVFFCGVLGFLFVFVLGFVLICWCLWYGHQAGAQGTEVAVIVRCKNFFRTSLTFQLQG